MKVIYTKTELEKQLGSCRQRGEKVAFVPTMGALHAGHISLIKAGLEHANLVVCSIFVNPTQFNDPTDLELYPRPLDRDLQLLESAGCEIVFMPAVDEMYPRGERPIPFDLGNLGAVWEAARRPGHFDGVLQIVRKLFKAVKPDLAMFGQKDLQQYKVIERLIAEEKIPVKLQMCPIIREDKGLAMSSRNVRLSSKGKEEALILFETLSHARERFDLVRRGELALFDLKQECENKLTSVRSLSLEYFAICDLGTLLEAQTFQPEKEYVSLVAASIEGVRLLDNMILS